MVQDWLPKLKAALNIDPMDMTQDESLSFALGAAWAAIEEHTRRRLLLQERMESQWRGSWQILYLERYPVEEVLGLTVDGVDIVDYHLDAERGMILVPQGVLGNITTAVYRAGYDPEDMPLPLVQACVILASAFYRSGEHGGRLIAGERLGDYQIQYFAGEGKGLVGIAPAAEALLRPYVRPMI